mmetsp:Transcript_27173/g.82420  ORF Transcript_27173/g.82420 Transcript_27173/m.82420 type:complete len:212 (-) Transcript_27173:1263-1898(-)
MRRSQGDILYECRRGRARSTREQVGASVYRRPEGAARAHRNAGRAGAAYRRLSLSRPPLGHACPRAERPASDVPHLLHAWPAVRQRTGGATAFHVRRRPAAALCRNSRIASFPPAGGHAAASATRLLQPQRRSRWRQFFNNGADDGTLLNDVCTRHGAAARRLGDTAADAICAATDARRPAANALRTATCRRRPVLCGSRITADGPAAASR